MRRGTGSREPFLELQVLEAERRLFHGAREELLQRRAPGEQGQDQDQLLHAADLIRRGSGLRQTSLGSVVWPTSGDQTGAALCQENPMRRLVLALVALSLPVQAKPFSIS